MLEAVPNGTHILIVLHEVMCSRTNSACEVSRRRGPFCSARCGFASGSPAQLIAPYFKT